MARKGSVDSGLERTKLRFFYGEFDGTGQSAQDLMHTLAQAISNTGSGAGNNRISPTKNVPLAPPIDVANEAADLQPSIDETYSGE